MKTIKEAYHFIGGVRFAIFLIATAALCVVVGTFLESATQSHQLAASYIYSHPLFTSLLCLFFANILFSALRRWPFKPKHIPFLITHLGLLMLLGGTIIKNNAGTQGTMAVTEGCCSQEIFIPDTYALLVEKRHPQKPYEKVAQQFPLVEQLGGGFKSDLKNDRSFYQRFLGVQKNDQKFPEIGIKLLAYSPNAEEKLQTWIKGNRVFLKGFPAFPVYESDNLSTDTLPVSITAKIGTSQHLWDMMAFRTEDVAKLAEQAYIQDVKVVVKKRETGSALLSVPLASILKNKEAFLEGEIVGKLDFNYSFFLGFQDPSLHVDLALSTGEKAKIKIPLNGAQSLLNLHKTSYLGSFPITVDLERPRTLLFIQDAKGTDHLFAFDHSGAVFNETFPSNQLSSLIVYDQGFRGYGVQSVIPFGENSPKRADIELANLHYLEEQLRHAMQQADTLIPPLKLLYDACQKSGEDFVHVFLNYLVLWDDSFSWLFPRSIHLPPHLAHTMSLISWDDLPLNIQGGCQHTCHVFSRLESHLKSGISPQNLIGITPKSFTQENLPSEESSTDHALLTSITQHFFQQTESYHNDQIELPCTPLENSRWLSAYFRAYNIHLKSLMLPLKPPVNSITIECPLTTAYNPLSLETKPEDNLPKLLVEITQNGQSEMLSLAYAKYGNGLKWPTKDGNYLLRFQPRFQKLPYRIRLRDARQINYPNSSQPLSYESDLLVTDLRDNRSVDTTISMNHVHQTWDGYRFYLANILPIDETAPQRAQIIVNHDPTKYFLTYPGGVILTIGILLLFWRFSAKRNTT